MRVETATMPVTVGTNSTDLERMRQAAESGDENALRAIGNKLEGVFVSMLVEKMREGMSEEGLFGDAPGADIYSGFFDQMMGEELSRRGGLGIGEMVVEAEMRRRAAVDPADLSLDASAPKIEGDRQ